MSNDIDIDNDNDIKQYLQSRRDEETEKGWMVVTDGNPREVRVLPQTRAGRSYVPKVEDDSWEITGDYVTIQN